MIQNAQKNVIKCNIYIYEQIKGSTNEHIQGINSLELHIKDNNKCNVF